MTQDDKKRAVARLAIEYVSAGEVLGVGTGSTANFFIEALAPLRDRIPGAVASSVQTEQRLRAIGIELVELNDAGKLSVYIDGADEATRSRQLIKGGGGALTREKVIAAAADCFICMVDDSKLCDRLGGYPLPLEVIPMARAHVTCQLRRHGAEVRCRDGFVTDNGNLILDAHGLDIEDPVALENELNQIAGVVSVGLFAQRPADVLLVAGDGKVDRF